MVSTYNNIELNDVIPEKLRVVSGYFDSSLNLKDVKELVAGKDYVIEYDSSYSSFTLWILNASKRLASNGRPAAYNVFYSTTSPANGTNVVNELSMSGNEQTITRAIDSTRTNIRVERSTKITSGGTIQIDTGYRITLYKQDAETGDALNGAEFEVISPSGQSW